MFDPNPFKDYPRLEKDDRFNDQPVVIPEFQIFGSVVLGVLVAAEFKLEILFFVAVVLPDNRLLPLAAFRLRPQNHCRSARSSAEHRWRILRAHAVRSESDSAQTDPRGIWRPHHADCEGQPGHVPDPLGLGVFAYYFVRRAGHYCLDWDFDLALFRGSELTNREESTPAFDRSVVTVCFEAERTENFKDLSIRPDPVGTLMDFRTPVQAFAKLVNRSRGDIPSDDPNKPSEEPLEREMRSCSNRTPFRTKRSSR